MAVQFTNVTQAEMDKFLTRAFRALTPRRSTHRGEIYYDLLLSSLVAVRVWTSIRDGASQGAGIGEDAIRIQLYSIRSQRPLKSGKAPIVKRTQNWRDNLQDRIEAEMEDYHDREGYWEGRA
jgi:hypothetical protein